MALWNKLRSELDRAGRAAQGALDEGKLRLEAFRARQLVDRAAQALGYAVYRDRVGKGALDDGALTRLVEAVRVREEELGALEAKLREAGAERAAGEEGASGEAAEGEARSRENPPSGG